MQDSHHHQLMHSSISRSARVLPTHASFTAFLSEILPAHPRDVPAIYHEPRYYGSNPATTFIQDVVLSITPTLGVYNKLTDLSLSGPRNRKPACFLHRPFDLDRTAVPRGTLVHACHKRFDELLTVGWNVALAARLGFSVATAVCVQGYKADPDRRIGLVAGFVTDGGQTLGRVRDSILREFGVGDVVPTSEDGPDFESRINGIAIMNAFGPDEVARAVDCAVQLGVIPEGGHAGLLYLTGESKELGVAALKEKYTGMFAVCVGHRPAEEWGIKYLGGLVKQEWPDVDVHIVMEDEEPIQRPKKVQKSKPSDGGPEPDKDCENQLITTPDITNQRNTI